MASLTLNCLFGGRLALGVGNRVRLLGGHHHALHMDM